MTHVVVDVHELTHTCPASADPHPIDIRHTIVQATPQGPCRTPVTVRCGTTTTTVSCGRRRPVARQCPACRPTIEIRHRTSHHLGPADPTPATTRPVFGLARRPCAVCGEPLAAVLAHLGRHLLCAPDRR